MSTYTEKEAKKLWCPEARVWSAGGANRGPKHGDVIIGSLCIASKCMAWRKWNPGERGDDRGYCGKAGRPTWGDA